MKISTEDKAYLLTMVRSATTLEHLKEVVVQLMKRVTYA